MRQLLILTLIICVQFLNAQEQRFYNLYQGIHIYFSQEFDDEYLLIGMDTIEMYNYFDGTIIFNSLSKDGTIVGSHKYINDTVVSLGTFSSQSHSVDDYAINISGSYKQYNKSYTLFPILFFFNRGTFEIDSVKNFGDYFNNKSARIILHHINGYKILLLGDLQYAPETNNITTFFGVYNTMDNSFFYQDYVRPNNVIMRPYQLHPAGEDEYYISVEQEYRTLPRFRRLQLIKIDNAGTELWRLQVGNNSTSNYNARVFDAPDGNYFVVWSDPFLPTNIPGSSENINTLSTIRIAKLIDHGDWAELIDEKDLRPELGYYERATYVIQDHYQAETGDIFLLLQTWGGHQSALVKVHANGIGAWMRIYRVYPENTADLTQTMLYGFSRTNDGGFMLTGEYRSSPGAMFPSGIQKALVIKTDSCGCLYEEGCNPNCADSYVNQFIYMQQAEIYPNPAKSEIHIKLPEQILQSVTYAIKIYSINGSLVKELELNCASHSINISELNSGFYTIHISGSGKYYVGRFVANK